MTTTGIVIDYSSTEMSAVWDEIEDVGPAGHPPHRRKPAEVPERGQQRRGRHDGQHRLIPGDVLQVHLRRHPRPASAACASAGSKAGSPGYHRPCRTPNTCWPPTSTCSSYHPEHDVRHYWDTHMCASFMVDTLGLRTDRRDRNRQGDVVVRLSAQRKHFRLFGEVAGRGGGRGRRRRRRPHCRGQHQKIFWGSSMTNSLTARGTAMDIPDEPDWARMRSEIGARLRARLWPNTASTHWSC